MRTLATFNLLPLILFVASVVVLALLSCAVQDLAAWWLKRQAPEAPLAEPARPTCPSFGCRARASLVESRAGNLYRCQACGTRFEWFDWCHWRILEGQDTGSGLGAEPRANVEAGKSAAWDWEGAD